MVVLSKIYTRTGDDGTTALGTGERRPKYDLRVEAFARSHLAKDETQLDAMLAAIQNDLFDLGADLATPENGGKPDHEPLRIVPAQVARLEKDIDRLNAELQPLRSFVLPGGSGIAAALHMARTICRRAERLMVALATQEPGKVGEAALHYINRLSDLLFVASRWVNDKGEADVLWFPGKNR
jgi:cob(I)alamin adenosyltransferase